MDIIHIDHEALCDQAIEAIRSGNLKVTGECILQLPFELRGDVMSRCMTILAEKDDDPSMIELLDYIDQSDQQSEEDDEEDIDSNSFSNKLGGIYNYILNCTDEQLKQFESEYKLHPEECVQMITEMIGDLTRN